MPRSKNKWKDYFTFSRKERNGMVIFLAVVGAVIAFPLLYNSAEKTSDATIPDKNTLKEQFNKQDNFFNNEASDVSEETVIDEARLFPFDPNTLTKEQWVDFGLSEKTANTIINYTSKGGRFYKAEDIRKIWGLKPEEADALIPYIKIERTGNRFSSYAANNRNIPVIDINTASAEDWKALPGIGEVLSERIVKYRNAVNGFTAIEDVKKVYGISDATFGNIRSYLRLSTKPQKKEIENAQPAFASEEKIVKPAGKVNINAASEREMVAAGVQRNIAKAIVVYRQQHGRFSTIQDVRKIIFVDEETYTKIAPLIVAE